MDTSLQLDDRELSFIYSGNGPVSSNLSAYDRAVQSCGEELSMSKQIGVARNFQSFLFCSAPTFGFSHIGYIQLDSARFGFTVLALASLGLIWTNLVGFVLVPYPSLGTVWLSRAWFSSSLFNLDQFGSFQIRLCSALVQLLLLPFSFGVGSVSGHTTQLHQIAGHGCPSAILERVSWELIRSSTGRSEHVSGSIGRSGIVCLECHTGRNAQISYSSWQLKWHGEQHYYQPQWGFEGQCCAC